MRQCVPIHLVDDWRADKIFMQFAAVLAPLGPTAAAVGLASRWAR
jgi:hypothetical protein